MTASKSLKNHFFSFFLPLFFLLPANHVSQAQTLESQPIFDVGDKWTFRFHDKGNRKEPSLSIHQAYKTDENNGWLYFENKDPEASRKQAILRFDYKRGEIKERFGFNPAAPALPGQRFVNNQPNDDFYQYPLAPGKKYTVKINWGNGQGYTEYKVEVKAPENIKTDAGNFEAYRIEMKGWWNRTSNGSGSGRVERTDWLAPSVKRFVRSEYSEWSGHVLWGNETSELIKWEPKAALPEFFAAPAAPSQTASGTK